MRPCLIEFTGTQEAGKTTTINKLEEKLISDGYKVKVIEEAISRKDIVVPRHNRSLRLIVIATILKDVLQVMEQDYDYVLLDRGIFDRLCWNELDLLRGYATLEEKKEREAFMKSSFIEYKSDIIVALTISAEESIRRRGKEGSFVTLENIKFYNQCFDQCMEKVDEYNKDAKVIQMNTENKETDDVIEQIYKNLINAEINRTKGEDKS